jgi:farnesyl-diphosphate farnesyltransferase
MEIDSGMSDEVYQDQILPHVSRTFALTIPQLPGTIRTPVTSAYLLCRIADTIEDEPALPATETFVYLQRFTAVVCGKEEAAPLARELAGRLSDRTLPAERDLVRNMEKVIRMMRRFDEKLQAPMRQCIEVMCHGMHHFQRTASVKGLARLSDLDSYCYYVAGCVGEMMTDIFCGHSPVAAQRRDALFDLAASFGQGLQMTNILKDIWEDRSRGACWLPQEVFSRHGIDLGQLSPERIDARFHAGVLELVGVAHSHLRNAMTFTLLIPPEETGIRRFCLWAIGLAVLTLKKIQQTPGFTAGGQVKVSRSSVMLTRILTNLAVRSDRMLWSLFERAAAGLPLAGRVAARTPQTPATLAEYGHHTVRAATDE